MAHLEKMPTYFVKGDKRKAAYYTIQARELIARGYVQEGAEKPQKLKAHEAKPVPEVVVEAGADAFEMEAKLEVEEENLDGMTKAELLDWALDRGHDLPNNDLKAEILKACKEIEAKA